MAAISDKLTTLNGIKSDIKAAIIAKGGTATNDFTTYATAISNLPSGGGSDDLKNLIERDITSINIPDGTTKIGNYAFAGCQGITSITIPNSVTWIGSSAFESCSNLTSVTFDTNYLITDDDISPFNDIFGTQVTEYIIGENVYQIGDRVFEDYTNLTSVTIGNSVTSIGEGAFAGCFNLTSVTIGESVTSIGDFAFRDCTGLTSITCLATRPPEIELDTFVGITATLYVPAASVADYQAESVWSDLDIQAIPSE